MQVLSLFDGISCGQIALERAGVYYDKYFASEIDKHAIYVTQKNYPATTQLGDVTKINSKDLPQIDLLIGGSPCQGFSTLGKELNFQDPRSRLFFEFMRLLNEKKPRYFLLENVRMKKDFSQIITDNIGVEPVEICSSLFSAQRRRRLYWTNIPFETNMQDRGIVLDDIIDHTVMNYKIPKNWQKRVPACRPKYVDPYNRKEITKKSTTLRTNCYNGNMWVRTQDAYRNLTRTEAEILQNVPVGYTDSISENQAKKCLGNGWTVDVIAHILSGIHMGNSVTPDRNFGVKN
jgi:DNA (cytosine-5)-methyltransferase 3A